MAKATAANNLRVILDALVKTHEERLKKEKQNKSKVKSKPDSNPAKRGAQGPRNAPSQGPSQRTNGLQGSRPKPKPNNAPPKSATPNASRVGEQIRQAKAVKQANPGRAERIKRQAARSLAARSSRLLSNPGVATGVAIAAVDSATRRFGDGTLKGKPNVPTKPGNHKANTKPTPQRKEGQKATLNGKPVVWKNGKWAPAPGSNAGNYNTRDADGTIRSRKKVGTKKVGTAEQAFDRAYAAAKKAGKKTFKFNNKLYSTK